MNTTAPFPNVLDTNQTAWLQSGSSQGLPVGVGNTLCNNQAGLPCGASQSNAQVHFSLLNSVLNNLLKLIQCCESVTVEALWPDFSLLLRCMLECMEGF